MCRFLRPSPGERPARTLRKLNEFDPYVGQQTRTAVSEKTITTTLKKKKKREQKKYRISKPRKRRFARQYVYINHLLLVDQNISVIFNSIQGKINTIFLGRSQRDEEKEKFSRGLVRVVSAENWMMFVQSWAMDLLRKLKFL